MDLVYIFSFCMADLVMNFIECFSVSCFDDKRINGNSVPYMTFICLACRRASTIGCLALGKGIIL